MKTKPDTELRMKEADFARMMRGALSVPVPKKTAVKSKRRKEKPKS